MFLKFLKILGRKKIVLDRGPSHSDYKNAKSQDEIANWRLQRATLKAPFSGIVSAVPGYPGIVVDISASNQTVVVIRK